MNRLTVFYDHIRNAMRQENMPFDEVAGRLTDAGISGVEIEYSEITEDLAKKLSRAGLPISSVYHTFNWDPAGKCAVNESATDPYLPYSDMLCKLNSWNIRNLLAIPGFVHEPLTHHDAMQSFMPRLNALCDAAGEYGIQILMEDFDSADAPFGTAAELAWFMQMCPGLGCAYDTGNFLFHGEDSLEVLPQLIDRIKYVHCKDRSLTAMHPERDAEDTITAITGEKLYSAAVGSGIIKMNEIITTILDHGYTGTFAIEHFGSQAMLDDMLSSAAYLNRLISQ